MVSQEKQLINAINQKRIDTVTFNKDTKDLVIPNNSGIRLGKQKIGDINIIPSSGATEISNTAGLQIGGASYNTNYLTVGGSSMMTISASGIGIGRPSAGVPTNGVILEIKSTTKGAILPKMTTAQKNTLAAVPAVEGTIIYDTDLHKLCVFTGAAFETITSA